MANQNILQDICYSESSSSRWWNTTRAVAGYVNYDDNNDGTYDGRKNYVTKVTLEIPSNLDKQYVKSFQLVVPFSDNSRCTNIYATLSTDAVAPKNRSTANILRGPVQATDQQDQPFSNGSHSGPAVFTFPWNNYVDKTDQYYIYIYASEPDDENCTLHGSKEGLTAYTCTAITGTSAAEKLTLKYFIDNKPYKTQTFSSNSSVRIIEGPDKGFWIQFNPTGGILENSASYDNFVTTSKFTHWVADQRTFTPGELWSSGSMRFDAVYEDVQVEPMQLPVATCDYSLEFRGWAKLSSALIRKDKLGSESGQLHSAVDVEYVEYVDDYKSAGYYGTDEKVGDLITYDYENFGGVNVPVLIESNPDEGAVPDKYYFTSKEIFGDDILDKWRKKETAGDTTSSDKKFIYTREIVDITVDIDNRITNSSIIPTEDTVFYACWQDAKYDANGYPVSILPDNTVGHCNKEVQLGEVANICHGPVGVYAVTFTNWDADDECTFPYEVTDVFRGWSDRPGLQDDFLTLSQRGSTVYLQMTPHVTAHANMLLPTPTSPTLSKFKGWRIASNTKLIDPEFIVNTQEDQQALNADLIDTFYTELIDVSDENGKEASSFESEHFVAFRYTHHPQTGVIVPTLYKRSVNRPFYDYRDPFHYCGDYVDESGEVYNKWGNFRGDDEYRVYTNRIVVDAEELGLLAADTVYPIYRDLEVTAIWNCVVTFKDYDGTILEVQEIEYGSSVIPTVTPVKQGSTFSGWDKNLTNITEDIVVTALYDVDSYKYTVKHYYETLTSGTYSTPVSVEFEASYGATVQGERISQDGFATPAVKTLTVGTDVDNNVIEYYYSRNTYQLTVSDCSGITVKVVTTPDKDTNRFKFEREVEIQATANPGYKFGGWNSAHELAQSVSKTHKFLMPAKAVTVRATSALDGVVYIDNGTGFEPYTIWIDNGTTWEQYIAYIDSGTEWGLCGSTGE